METGFGNRVDPAFISKDLNFMSGAVKVQITGSDGMRKSLQLRSRRFIFMGPVFSKNYSEFGFGAEDLPSIAFSGNHFVVPNHTNASKGTIKYYNLSGEYEGVLDVTDVVIRHSLREFASDTKGTVLVADLEISSREQTVYKWDNVTAKPVPYIKYSKASLGLDYNPRSAGINISGNLDDNAIIVIGMAQKTDIFVWTVRCRQMADGQEQDFPPLPQSRTKRRAVSLASPVPFSDASAATISAAARSSGVPASLDTKANSRSSPRPDSTSSTPGKPCAVWTKCASRKSASVRTGIFTCPHSEAATMRPRRFMHRGG